MERIRPLTEEETEAFKTTIKNLFLGVSFYDLELAMRFNKRTRQYLDAKIEVLQELINAKARPDNKYKQFHDEDN